MLIFKALHILSMFSVVAIEIGAEFLYVFTISRRDVPALASVHRIAGAGASRPDQHRLVHLAGSCSACSRR